MIDENFMEFLPFVIFVIILFGICLGVLLLYVKLTEPNYYNEQKKLFIEMIKEK